MLSLHTDAAALSAQNSIGSTQSKLSTSMTRLSTGYRINSAMDDAAGLQIATRLQAQTSGMAMAMRNTQNSISMMQTAEGSFDEVTNMLVRMKDLATQAADASSTAADKTAMQSEFDALTNELSNVMGNTTFGGTALLKDTTGTLSTGVVNFQIGASTSETMAIDVSGSIATLHGSLLAASAEYSSSGTASTATGNTAQQNVVVGNGITQAANTDLQGMETLLNQMDNTIAALQVPGVSANNPAVRATLNANLDGIDTAMGLVSVKIATFGGTQNILSTLDSNHSNVSLSNKTAELDLGELDYSAAAIDLNGYTLALQATQKAYAKVSSLSLFNAL